MKFRSSRPEVLCKKGVLKSFAKFTGKHLCQSLFFNKFGGLTLSLLPECIRKPLMLSGGGERLGPATLLKKRLWHRNFPVSFAKFLRICFLTELRRWLLANSLTNCHFSKKAIRQTIRKLDSNKAHGHMISAPKLKLCGNSIYQP